MQLALMQKKMEEEQEVSSRCGSSSPDSSLGWPQSDLTSTMPQAQRLPPPEGDVPAASSSSGLGTTANTTTVGTSAGRSDLFSADGASTPPRSYISEAVYCGPQSSEAVYCGAQIRAAMIPGAHYGAPRAGCDSTSPPPRQSARNFKRAGATVLKGGRVVKNARGLGSSRSETGKWVETSKGVWAYEVAKPASVSTEVAALTARGAKAVSDHQPAEVVLPLTFGDIFVQSPAVRLCLLHNCEVESLAVMRQLCSTFMRDVPRVINSKDWQLKHRCVILYKESSRKQCTTLYRLDPTFYRQYPSIFLYPSELYPQEVYPQEAVWIAIITATRPTNELASADFDQLVAMGFDASKVAAALSQNRGDREKALNMLLSGASRISWSSADEKGFEMEGGRVGHV